MAPQSNQDRAFQRLFTSEYGKLCRYALTYLHDEQAAEDIVQDTFVRIWEQKRDIVEGENARFYLVAAVRNNCITALRKQKTQQVRYTDMAPEPEPDPEPTLSAAQLHEQESEQARKIAEALNRLPPKCREVFLLIKMQGMSYKQAAETLELSVKTIENQMGKAIRILRESAAAAPVLLFWLLTAEKMPGIVGVGMG